MQLFKCSKINLRLINGAVEEYTFIKDLFQFPDIKKYYVLRNDHASNLDAFVDFMAFNNKNFRAFNFIIELQDTTPIGLITAEPIQDNNGIIMWNIGYAVHPGHRRQGYAHDALNGLVSHLQNFKIQYAMLDINKDNVASESLAIKCGFRKMRSQTGGNVGFFDFEHMDISMRFRWIKDIHSISTRDKLNQEAIACHRAKNYQKAIALYVQSLDEPYAAGSPFSDGQIYANLGMAYSSIQCYREAYDALTKAYSMNIHNASVMKELAWLKTKLANNNF